MNNENLILTSEEIKLVLRNREKAAKKIERSFQTSPFPNRGILNAVYKGGNDSNKK